MQMNIEKNFEKNFLVLTPKLQAVDNKVAKDFKATTHHLVEEADFPYTILNLEEVQFIDSVGFSAIISLLKLLTSKDRDLVLVALTPPIQELFDMMNMERVFEIYPTITEAQHALSVTFYGG